jgi:hypothetical protein
MIYEETREKLKKRPFGLVVLALRQEKTPKGPQDRNFKHQRD